MNYIQQINWFEQWAEMNMPSTGQYALYYALLALNNRSGWKEWFKVANISVTERIGMTPQGVRKARSYLVERGLIEIQMVGSNKATLYKIVPLNNEIVSANYSTSGIVTATVSAEDDLPIEKFPQQFPVLKPKQDLKPETKDTTTNGTASEVEQFFLMRRGKGLNAGNDDHLAIMEVIDYGIPAEFINHVVDKVYTEFKPKYPRHTISNFSYCLPRIYEEWHLKQEKEKGGVRIAEFRTSSQRRVGEYDKLSL